MSESITLIFIQILPYIATSDLVPIVLLMISYYVQCSYDKHSFKMIHNIIEMDLYMKYSNNFNILNLADDTSHQRMPEVVLEEQG